MSALDLLRVVVAESLPETRISDAFKIDRTIDVVCLAHDGITTVTMTRRLHPDAVIVDSTLVRPNALETTRIIMSETPTPIIIVTDRVDSLGVQIAMEAQLAGALATAERPTPIDNMYYAERSSALVGIVRTMAGLKLVRRWHNHQQLFIANAQARRGSGSLPSAVAIGASTGGPAALHQILSDIPSAFGAPILVTQHISPGFVDGMTRWLNEACVLSVKVAEHGERLNRSTVYVAGDNRHMTVTADQRIALTKSDPIDGHRPSASVLFRSIADAFGAGSVAVILTGMGVDGARGLVAVRQAGGRVIAQDEASSAVFGMPQAAISAGLADVVLPIAGIAQELTSAVAAS